MASILETFLILFETDAKKAEREMVSAEAAAERLAEVIDRVGKIDPTNIQAVDAGIKEASAAASVLRDALVAAGSEGVAQLDSLVAGLEDQLAVASGEATALAGGLASAKTPAADLRAALTDPVGDAAKSTTPLAEGLAKAKEQAKGLKNEVADTGRAEERLGTSFMGMARRFAAPIAGLFTVAAITGEIRGRMGEIIELTEKASRYNFNVEGYNAVNQIIEDMGGNAADAERYIKRFADTVSEAYGDMASEPGKVLKSLKVDAADAKGNLKDTEQVLLDVAGALEGLSRRAQIDKLRKLGIIDPAMIKLVLQGRDAVEKLMAAEKAKGLITNETARRTREFKLALDDAKDAISTLINRVIGWAMPGLAAMAKGLEFTVKWLSRNSTLVQGFGIAMAIAGAVIMATFVPAIWAAAAGVLAATWPILAIIAAVLALGAAFALVYEDIQFFLKGQPSLIGDLAKKYAWFADIVRIIGDVFKWLAVVVPAALKAVWGALTGLWDAFVAFQKFLIDMWVAYAKVVGSVMRTVWAIVGPVIRLIMDIVGALAAIWAQHFAGMLATAKAVFSALWPVLGPVFQIIMAGLGILRDVWGGATEFIAAAWGTMGAAIAAAWDATIGGIIAGVQRAIDWVRKLLGLRTDAEARGEKQAKDAKATAAASPAGRAATAAAVSKGQGALGRAGAAPLAATSSGAVAAAGARTVTKTNTVTVEKVEVNTQATDADGMAKAAGGALKVELRRASAQWDDGVEA